MACRKVGSIEQRVCIQAHGNVMWPILCKDKLEVNQNSSGYFIRKYRSSFPSGSPLFYQRSGKGFHWTRDCFSSLMSQETPAS